MWHNDCLSCVNHNKGLGIQIQPWSQRSNKLKGKDQKCHTVMYFIKERIFSKDSHWLAHSSYLLSSGSTNKRPNMIEKRGQARKESIQTNITSILAASKITPCMLGNYFLVFFSFFVS